MRHSAVGGLRTYNSAMLTYSNAGPDIGYPASLQSLGPGSRDCSRLDLVSEQLAAPLAVRNGYRFVYSPEQDADRINWSYRILAAPVEPGATGVRYFFTDQTAVIRASVGIPANAASKPLE
jgi:hypothetical protein